MVKKSRENGGLLAMENIDKTAMAEVAKISSAINLGNKYNWAISNADIHVTKDLGLTGINKYWRYVSQIEDEVDGLHKDWIPTFGTFIKHSKRMHDNEEVTENMMIKCEIDLEWVSSLFI